MLPTGSLRRAAGGAIPDLPGYGEGAWWVQDAAAALPAHLLGEVRGQARPRPVRGAGRQDRAARRGRRARHRGRPQPRPARAVADNLARTGLAAELVAGDGRTSPPAPSDAVLLDAPCTATGTLRRHPDIARTKGPDDVARTAALQDALLANAARAGAPGRHAGLRGVLAAAGGGRGPHRRVPRRAPGLRRGPVAADEIGGLAEP